MSPRRDSKKNQDARQLAMQEDGTVRFEALYSGVHRDLSRVPWQRNAPQPLLTQWVDREGVTGAGRRAMVVGCGLGDDSEYLAGLGFSVLAFDISPSAVEWCRELHPRSAVGYQVGDLLHPPEEWSRGFDLVFESLTLQSLPALPRTRAFRPLADFVAPDGDLLVIARGREPADPDPGPPWALTRDEMDRFVQLGLRENAFEDMTQGMRMGRTFRARYQRVA